MILDRIGYQKLFSLPNYENEKVIIEGQLEAGDDIQECLLQLKKQTEKFHKDNNPQLTDGGTVDWKFNGEIGMNVTAPIRQQPPTVDYKAKDDLEKKIDNATTQDELLSMREEIIKYGLLGAYETKLKQLNEPPYTSDQLKQAMDEVLGPVKKQ